jgi:ADP-heptose:LPS heptosyltransferase
MQILIIKPSSLGDVIHALRIAKQIRDNIPSVSIDWVIKSELKPILTVSGIVRRNFLYQRTKGIRAYLSLIKQIRKQKYDLVLDLQGLLRSAVLLRCSHSQSKIGVADGREFSTFLYKSIGESSRKTEIHAIDRLVPFLNHLGVNNWNRELLLTFPKSEISPSTHQYIGEKDFILLFPESRRQEKVWPHFLKLSKLLTKYSRLSIVVAGNNRDESYPGTIDLRGRIQLAELPALIHRASVVVSNDSAPLHIASSLKKPLIALFGPTSAMRYGPYPQNSEQNIVLSAQEKDLETISVEQVAISIEKSLGR